MLVSSGNAVGVSVLVPGIDFLVVELSEIEIVLGSLEDCAGFEDMFRSLVSLISSSEEQFHMDSKGKSFLLVALLKELPVSLRCNISEMLGESIWDCITTSVSGNSWDGKSGDGIGTGTEVEVLYCISTPCSEMKVALLGTWTFFRIFILPICGCAVEGLYSFGYPFSSKKSTGSAAAYLMPFVPVEEDWFCRLELSFGKLPDFLQHFWRRPLIPQALHVTFLALHSSRCFLLNGSPHRKDCLLDSVEPEELEFCSLEGFLDFLLLLSYDT